MSTFTVQATLSHPERRGQSVTLDLVVGTRATYTVLPAEIVGLLALPAPYERPVENEIRVSEEPPTVSSSARTRENKNEIRQGALCRLWRWPPPDDPDTRRAPRNSAVPLPERAGPGVPCLWRDLD